jgi:hypothetical protein
MVHVQLVGTPFIQRPFFRPTIHKGYYGAGKQVTQMKSDFRLMFLDGTAPLDVSAKAIVYLVLIRTQLQCRKNASCRNLTFASSENGNSQNLKGTISE